MGQKSHLAPSEMADSSQYSSFLIRSVHDKHIPLISVALMVKIGQNEKPKHLFPFLYFFPHCVNPATIKENMSMGFFLSVHRRASGISIHSLISFGHPSKASIPEAKKGGILLISATKPFVKFHKYDAELASDVHALNSAGYNSDDIWVLKWNPDKNHSNQRNNFYKYSTHFESAVGHIDSMAHFFDNGGKELRTRLEKLGLTKDECSALVRELQDTDYTCLLVVRDLKDNIIKMND